MKHLLLAAGLLVAAHARAAEYDDAGDDLTEHPDHWLTLDGALRTRGALLDNFDLDRGLDPSGRPIFPVPASASGQLLTRADSRLRADLSAFAPAGGLAVKARFDAFDATPLASPDGQPSPEAARPRSELRLQRAYG